MLKITIAALKIIKILSRDRSSTKEWILVEINSSKIHSQQLKFSPQVRSLISRWCNHRYQKLSLKTMTDEKIRISMITTMRRITIYRQALQVLLSISNNRLLLKKKFNLCHQAMRNLSAARQEVNSLRWVEADRTKRVQMGTIDKQVAAILRILKAHSETNLCPSTLQMNRMVNLTAGKTSDGHFTKTNFWI